MIKNLLRFVSVVVVFAVTMISQHAAVQTGTKTLSEDISIKQPAAAPLGPKTLIVYDAPPGSQFSKLGMVFGIMLKT